MSFPTVAGFSGTNSGANVTSTTVDITALTGTPAVGDLIIIIIVKDGTGAFTWPGTDWTIIQEQAFGAGVFSARYRVRQSGDSTTVAITHASEGTAHQCYRISAGTFAGVPEGTYAESEAGSANPDPPSETASWGAADNLWIAACGNDGNVAVTAAPANYTANFRNDRWANTGGCGVASGRRELNTATENPGTFTMASEQWGAATIVIQPSTNQTITAGGNTVTTTAPTATLAAGAATLPAGAQTVTITAPSATLIQDQFLAAGQALVTFTAPDATISAGGGGQTLPAGGNTVTVTAPAATVATTVSVTAGQALVTFSAPTATVASGAVTLPAGAQTVVVTAPTATISVSGGAQTIAAGPNTVIFTAPAATISGGGTGVGGVEALFGVGQSFYLHRAAIGGSW